MRRNILVILICLFSLSQLSSLVVSLYKYNKDYASMVSENEESEEWENEECNYEDYSFCPLPEFNTACDVLTGKLYRAPGITLKSSFLAKPETPPPNAC